jgi:tRNA(Ile)-lysidine synthetase-like protein
VPRIIGDAALLSAFAPLEAYPSAALAVSGGPDSMALMHLAARWLTLKGRTPASIAVLTVDHGLRPEAAEEAAFVATRAARLGFAHATLAWAGQKPKTGIQAAAREARYRLMTAYACEHGIGCLVTAHTEDDQAETFLMRLRRGSGLDGLAAMAAVSERGGVPIVRPLLGLSKARLNAYLRSLGVPFASDPSNSNVTFERVRLRHAMKALAAAGIARPALALSASRLGRSRDALASTADEFLQRHFRVTSLGQAQIGLEPFLELAPEIALRVLSRALALTGGKEEPPRMAKVERLLNGLYEPWPPRRKTAGIGDGSSEQFPHSAASFPRGRVGAKLRQDGAMNGGIAPHPVLLPMGEGTPECGTAIAAAFPLPGGEGQGEGRKRSSSRDQASGNPYVSAYARGRESTSVPGASLHMDPRLRGDDAGAMAHTPGISGAGKREAALGGCLIIVAAGVLNFYREPGRMGKARQACQPGSTFIWDGRFVLTLSSDLSGNLSVAPLGAAGWAICRNALKKRGKSVQANRLAALATPALWQGSRLLYAPAVRFTDAELAGAHAVPLRTQLVPRLSHFLIST